MFNIRKLVSLFILLMFNTIFAKTYIVFVANCFVSFARQIVFLPTLSTFDLQEVIRAFCYFVGFLTITLYSLSLRLTTDDVGMENISPLTAFSTGFKSTRISFMVSS